MTRRILESRSVRIVLPLVVLVLWFGVAGAGGPTFGKISKVESNNQSNFLPASADSTRVQDALPAFQSSTAIPAVVLISGISAQSQSDSARIAQVQSQVKKALGTDLAGGIVGPIWSKSGTAAEFIVPIESSAALNTAVDRMRTALGAALGSSVKVYVTGPAGLAADLISAFGGIDGILLLVALVSVFVILLLVYRSIILPIVVLLLDMFALSAAILAVYTLAYHGIIKLNGEAQGILSILVIGAATDYSLLLIARYREALLQTPEAWKALTSAVRSAVAPISASAVTVILALLCLLFSQLRSNQSLGPVAAIGIASSYIAGMTFLPAVLLMLRRTAFWPYLPRYMPTSNAKDETRGVWAAVSRRVGTSPRMVWVTTLMLLILGAAGLTQLRASGVSNAATIRTPSNAVAGQKVLAEYFPAGAGSPVDILVPAAEREAALRAVRSQSGLANAAVFTGSYNPAVTAPVIRNGQILITAVLQADPTSARALATITELRHAVAAAAPGTLVGGESATALDTNLTAKNDLRRIIPIVLLVVLVILIILLRALIAPVLLIVSVLLSYSSTLGISALLFNGPFHYPGADPTVPLFGFIFLVALGIDYNIFLMSRVREESQSLSTREAILRGLQVTGGVITSAGVVLAATFAALGVIPILFLIQLAVIVALGVLIDTIIVRSLLIPALSIDIGKLIWWPGHAEGDR